MTCVPGSRAGRRGCDQSQYTIPTVVERTSVGGRADDIYSRLLSERISSSAPRSTTAWPT